MKKLKMTVSAMCAAAALSAFAVGKGTDSTGEYWEDASGVKHYYLFQKTYSGTCWGGAFTYDRTQTETATGSWKNGTIWTFEKDTSYGAQQNSVGTRSPYGIHFEVAKTIYIENTTLNIGAYGVRSEVGGHKFAIYNGTGARRITLAESQTWTGPASDTLTANAFVIVANQPYKSFYTNHIYAADNVVWTIEGDTFLHMLTYTNDLSNADMVIRAPAIVSVPRHAFGDGRLYARSLTIDGGAGIYFGKNTSMKYSSAPDSGYGLGSIPLISPVQIAQTIVLTNGATLTALETTTVTGGVTIVSAGTTPNAFSGTFSFVDDETVIQIPAGATLDLTEATLGGTGDFALTGEGTVKVAMQADSDGYCNLDSWIARHMSDFEGSAILTVAEGTMVIANASSIPSGCTIVTSGDGAVLVVDDTDFDAETQLGGTRNVMAPSRLIVTDEEVTGEVVVNKGETLLVFGNGLGENASLDIWGGTVMFRRTATISAPVWYTNTVYCRTFDASVTGIVAGVLSISPTPTADGLSAMLQIDSPGFLRFSGSGQIGTLLMNTGNAEVTGEYDVYGGQRFDGGHMTLRDGGHFRIRKTWQYLRLDDNPSRDVCLEIAEGGTFEKVAGNCYTYIGTGRDYESKLLLTGGTFIHKYDAFALKGGGVIDIQSGVFQTGRRIECNSTATAENANIYVRNGTLCFNGGGAGYAYAMFEGAGRCTTTIDGNATLQVMYQSKMPDTTNETELAQCTWRCTEGSRLKVFANNKALVTLHNFEADGLVFDTNSDSSSARAIEVRIVDPKDPLALGYVLPGFEGSTITASNAVPDLVASYVVPEGVSFDTAALPTDWYENFGDVTLSNLTFETGSSLSFPFFGGTSPLSIAGRLALPESMGFAVASQGSHADVTAAPVVVPALGTVQPEGGTAFTCAGGVRKTAASLSVEEGALAFSYKLNGSVFSLR